MVQVLTAQPDLWSVLQCLTSLIAQSQEFYFPFLWLGWSSWLLKYFWDPCFVLGLLDLEVVTRDIAAYSTSGYGTPVYICFKMPKLAVLWWSLPASSSVKASCRFLHQLSQCEVPKSVLCPVYPQGRWMSLLGALAGLQVSSWSSPSMWTENNVDTVLVLMSCRVYLSVHWLTLFTMAWILWLMVLCFLLIISLWSYQHVGCLKHVLAPLLPCHIYAQGKMTHCGTPSLIYPVSLLLCIGRGSLSAGCTFHHVNFNRRPPFQTALLAWWLRCLPQEWNIWGWNHACTMGISQGRVIPVTYKLALQWLPRQAPGIIGSALGLVGPVSVYCDWVRWRVWSATAISVWQHEELSRSIPEIR